MENLKPGSVAEANSSKEHTDISDITTDILQYEKLIDPGNEHSHHVDEEKSLMKIKR